MDRNEKIEYNKGILYSRYIVECWMTSTSNCYINHYTVGVDNPSYAASYDIEVKNPCYLCVTP